MSEYGIIVNNFRPRTIFVHTIFLPRAKKHSDLCAFIFITCVRKILTVDSGISKQFNYLNWNIIYLYANKKYCCVSFFFSVLSRIYPGNSLFCMGKSIFLWQLARLARPPAHSPPGTCRLPSTYHHEPFLHERWCDRPVFTFGSFLRPSTGISASFLIVCMLSRDGRHIFVDCCVLTGELTFLVFSF